MVEEVIKTDEELDNEYYDWYYNKAHTQSHELSEGLEYAYQKWYDENELSFKKLKDNGYSERAILKKAFMLGLKFNG